MAANAGFNGGVEDAHAQVPPSITIAQGETTGHFPSLLPGRRGLWGRLAVVYNGLGGSGLRNVSARISVNAPLR